MIKPATGKHSTLASMRHNIMCLVAGLLITGSFLGQLPTAAAQDAVSLQEFGFSLTDAEFDDYLEQQVQENERIKASQDQAANETPGRSLTAILFGVVTCIAFMIALFKPWFGTTREFSLSLGYFCQRYRGSETWREYYGGQLRMSLWLLVCGGAGYGTYLVASMIA
ncbi:MAG: hypothetical protein VB862_12980 [Pirellulaceae bacterium]